MLKIGLTGGIGSGKTTVARFFSLLGVPVYNSDLRARELMQHDPDLIKEITAAFGADSYIGNGGELNRAYLAGIVFNNATELARLNALVHPAVFRDFDSWTLRQTSPYVIKEAAILFESGSYKDCDAVILVTAPAVLRIARVSQRDNLSEEQVRDRIKNQLSDEEKSQYARFIVSNDEQSLLIPQLLTIHQLLLEGNL